MRHKTLALLFSALALIMTVAVVFTMVDRFGGGQTAAAADGLPQTVSAPNTAPGAPAAAPAAEPAAEPTPTSDPTPTPEPTATPWPGPVVPERTTAAPQGYFADAAFLGNSLVTGLDFYDYSDVLSGATFYAANSVTVLGVAEYVAQMAGTQYGKVYVGLGTNEMSYDRDTLRQAFNNMIDQLQANNPGCIIYLMSVTPVSEYKSSTDRYFTREWATDFNEMLKDIAKERQVWYLDVFPALANEKGYLPSEVTVDGVHFTPGHYEIWFNYLQTHYVDDGKTYSAPAEEITPQPDETAAEGAGA